MAGRATFLPKKLQHLFSSMKGNQLVSSKLSNLKYNLKEADRGQASCLNKLQLPAFARQFKPSPKHQQLLPCLNGVQVAEQSQLLSYVTL